MAHDVEDVSPTTKRLKINIPVEVIQSETDSLYKQISSTANIPGFRQGKVPMSILVSKYAKSVEAQVIEKIVPQYYMEAVKAADLEPVTYPNIEDKIELTPGEPLNFTVTVEVKPELGELKYEGIDIKSQTAACDDSDVEKSLKFFQESKALYSATDDVLAMSDMAIVDIDAYVDGELKDELSMKEYPIVIGQDAMSKDFDEVLEGKKKGDTAEVTVKYEENHESQDVAGKDVVYKLNIKEGKKKNLPPFDDELAQSAGCETMDELKSKIRESILARREGEINLDYKKEVINELIKRHDFPVPESMVSGEMEAILEKVRQDAERTGQSFGSEAELRQEHEKTAIDNVKSVMLLEAIGKQEKVEVTEDEVKNAMQEIAERNNLKPEEVMKLYAVREGSMDALKSRLFADKVLDLIVEKSTISNG
ncbi:MAG: trigger factor [Nitrospira sp.]|nr:trigger factor [Nitrospira sp.]